MSQESAVVIDSETDRPQRASTEHPQRDHRHRRPRARSIGSPASRRRHHRLRLVFFSAAALWGFCSGCVLLLGLGDAAGAGSRQGLETWTLALAALVAVVGGLIVSAAYRQSVGRG